jgi:peptidoglycan/LPS O-acetylase OafA/YrhL
MSHAENGCSRDDEMAASSLYKTVTSNSDQLAGVGLGSRYELPEAIPQLDRLRGLAIVMVLIAHSIHSMPEALVSFAGRGWMGVDLFFVLSGFLITGILWKRRTNDHYFSRFYGRRLLRIWPVYLLMLGFAFLLLPILKERLGGPLLNIPAEPLAPWPFLLMIQNFFSSRLYLSATLVATWSLAIEEQFYLLWPFLIRRASLRILLTCLIIGVLLAPLLRIATANWGWSARAIYMSPLTHGDGLLCGAAVAIWLRVAKPRRRNLLFAGLVLLLFGFVLLLSTATVQRDWGQPWPPLVFSAAALLSTGLLLVALVSENTGHLLHRYFFMNKVLAFLGFISYGLYLYHFFFFRLAVSDKIVLRLDLWHHASLTRLLLLVCTTAICILIAWISRVTIEQAALSKKGIFG